MGWMPGMNIAGQGPTWRDTGRTDHGAWGAWGAGGGVSEVRSRVRLRCEMGEFGGVDLEGETRTS